MFLTSKNDLLYDAKNFDKYRNIYCILLNKKKIENRQYNLDNHNNKLQHEYYDEVLKLFFLFEEYSLAGERKIVFGHYYNKKNTFLYKNVQTGKVVSYEVKRCNNNELYYKNNKLVCANTYDIIKKQLEIINLDETNKYNEKYHKQLEISYNKENNNLSIDLTGTCITSFNNGCLNINNIN